MTHRTMADRKEHGSRRGACEGLAVTCRLNSRQRPCGCWTENQQSGAGCLRLGTKTLALAQEPRFLARLLIWLKGSAPELTRFRRSVAFERSKSPCHPAAMRPRHRNAA